MRSFFVVASILAQAFGESSSTIASTTIAEAPQLVSPVPKLLEEVYGAAVKANRTMGFGPTPLSPEYYSTRTPDNCIFPLDIVVVQDSTGSFADDFVAMRDTQLQLMVDAIQSGHPGSRFGLVSFKDRPVPTLGETYDYCHRVDLGLQADGFTPLYDAYGKLWSNGGMDPAENQFGAIIAALQSSEVGWAPEVSGSLASKLIVLSTDSWPHFSDDGLNVYGMTPNTGVLDANEDAQCRQQYYPSPEQVRNVIFASRAYSAFLVFDGNYADMKVADSWRWFNTFIGQEDEFVDALANDASNFWTILEGMIKTIEDDECVYTTTAPTTTAPTTLASTAVPTAAPTVPVTTTIATTALPTAAPVTTTTTTTTAPATTIPTAAPATTIPTTAPATTTTTTTTTTAPATTTTAPATTTTTTTAPATTTTPAAVPTTTTGGGVCPPCAGPEPCPCPEVLIKLLNRPAELHLDVINKDVA